jgi:hypothetical protein
MITPGDTRQGTENDVLGTPDEFAQSEIVRGTVGWDDSSPVLDLGDSTKEGGTTLLKVTLYRGRDATKRPEKGRAQGHRILVSLLDGFFRIPPRGSECVIAIADGDYETPGAGILMGCVARANLTSGVYKNLREGEACIHAGTSDSSTNCLLIKNDGRIVLATQDAQKNAVFVRLDATKMQIVAPWGSQLFDFSGYHVRAGAAKFDMGQLGGTAFDALGGAAIGAGTYCTITCANITALGVCQLGLPSIPGAYFQTGLFPIPASPPSGLVPVPLLPPMAPTLFFSPSVRCAV